MINTISNSLKQIGLLTIALTLALLANFAYGQWIGPSAPPPYGNVAPPINVSANAQTKAGDLGAARMLSDQYCDSTGANCVSTSGGSLAGATGIQTGSVTGTTVASTESIWVPFPTPFAYVPEVFVSLNNYGFSSGCSNSPGFVIDVAAEGITQFGFFMRLGGHIVCGGIADVNEASWIAF